jgi:signal transduction histidine kinase
MTFACNEEDVDQPTVIIIADDPEFARAIMARWQTERAVPAFTLMSSAVWDSARAGKWDLAIVGCRESALPLGLLRTLEAEGAPVIVVSESAAAAQTAREKMPRVIVLRAHEGWPEAAVAVGGEALRRVEAVQRAQEAAAAATQLQHDATLGRYMLDKRHSLNNALTSVLGNSELLLLEPGALSAPVRDQIDTIRNMALRMHEIIQRFSSLEAEMRFHDMHGQAAGRGHGNGVGLAAKAGD